MKHLYASLAFFFVLLFNTAHASSYQPLIETQQLSAALDDQAQLQIIDIRSPDAYAAGHIPGAISAPYGQWRGPAHNPGQLSSDDAFQQLLRQLGLTDQQPIVVYSSGDDETDFGATARVYWTLKYLGLTKLSILNGGFREWTKAQQQISSEASAITASQYSVRSNPQLAIFKDELLEKITEQNPVHQLLDSRPPLFYQGKVKAPTASVGGTIATAQNTPFTQWFNQADTRVRPVAEIKQLVREQGLDQAQETLSFCNTGHWAATNWFVLSELAELPQVRLYPASMAEWTQSEVSLPMDNTPSRLEQVKTKFAQLVKN
ncbi:MAG TPA: sulfurtransferase [Thiopseudomonas sp.]|nr:sulfurtransferase [Thiopseudomonas sp.]